MRQGPKLSPEQRELVLRAYRNGDKCELIAAVYGITAGYVTLLARRARLPSRSGAPRSFGKSELMAENAQLRGEIARLRGLLGKEAS